MEMEIEEQYKRKEVGEEEEEEILKSWELIPQQVLQMRIFPLLPIHSLIRVAGVCREWNKLVQSWELLGPFLLEERSSSEVLGYCLLKRLLPLPEEVESREREDGSDQVIHTVSAWSRPFLLAVAAPVQVMEGSSHWEIRVWELLIMNDDISHARWRMVEKRQRRHVECCKVVGDQMFFRHSYFYPLLPKVTSFRIRSYHHD